MKAAALLLALTLLSIGSPPRPAAAGPNAGAKIVIHLVPAGPENLCGGAQAVPLCAGIYTGPVPLGLDYFGYVLVQQADANAGVGGATFGLQYDPVPGSGVDVLDWHLCADGQSPDAGWPASGTGNSVTWNPGTCPHVTPPGGITAIDGVAVVGYFDLIAWTPGTLDLTPRPGDGLATVTSCAGVVDTVYGPGTVPSTLGEASFGAGGGYNPCGPLVVVGYCAVLGPDNCTTGSLVAYSIDVGAASIHHQVWSCTGNGSIVGPDDENDVQVQAGAPGVFTLEFIGGDIDFGVDCRLTVTVEDVIPAVPSTWGRIKAQYREP